MSDPNWSNVSLLLHCDGSDGSTTFTDSSGTPKTVTANGDAHVEVDQYKFGGASAHFDGSGDYLSLSSALIANESYTIECWIRLSSRSSDASWGRYLYSQYNNSVDFTNRFYFGIPENNSTKLCCYHGSGGGLLTSTGNVALDTWTHVATTYDGSTRRLFLDGNLEASVSTSGASLSSANSLIGCVYYGTTIGFWHGYIDEMRVTKGVARYTASFTPPTAAFEEGSGVSGTLSGTLSDAIGSLSGSVGVSGSLSATLASLSGSISAMHVPPVTGTLSGTLSGLSGSLYGTHATPVTGTLSGTLANLTGSLSGSFGMNGAYGTLSGNLSGVSGSFSGAHLHPVAGTLAGYLANLTGSMQATTGEPHRIRRGPWMRIRSDPNLVLLSCDDDDAGLNHSVVVSVGNINRPGDGSETGSVRVDLDNYDGRVSRLLAVPPLGARASLYGPDGDLWFDGTLASVNLSETAALQLEE